MRKADLRDAGVTAGNVGSRAGAGVKLQREVADLSADADAARRRRRASRGSSPAGAASARRSIFPLRQRCPTCGGAVERMLLPPRGTLWTWTTQGFEPEAAVRRRAGRVRAVRRRLRRVRRVPPRRGPLTEADPARLRIGMPMEVVAIAQRRASVTYAFAPVEPRRVTEIAVVGAGHPSVRAARRRQRPRDGRPRGARCARRCRSRVARRPGRLRRQRGRRQRRHDGGRPRPDGPPVRQRQERLRDRRLVARRRACARSSRARTRSASSSASTSTRAARSRTIPPTGRCPQWYGADRPDGDDAVLRREAAALYARPRDPGTRRWRRSPRRRSRTAR